MEMILKKISYKFNQLVSVIKELFDKDKVNEEVDTECDSETENENEETIKVNSKSLKSEIDYAEQMIKVFEKSNPEKFSEYTETISKLRDRYMELLDESDNELTFEIDPEQSSEMHQDINKLVRSIQNYIDTEFMYERLYSKLNLMILRMSAIYNSLMKHPDIVNSVLVHINNAMDLEVKLAEQMKSCNYIMQDVHLKNRMIELFSYIDYLILKTRLRANSVSPDEGFRDMLIIKFFIGFDYTRCIKSMIEDEVANLREFVAYLTEDAFKNLADEKIAKVLGSLAHSDNVYALLTNTAMWEEVFELENSLKSLLNHVGFSKFEIKLIERMGISESKENAMKSVKQIVYLELIKLYDSTNDDMIWLILKFWNNISDEITYKYLYFLFQLFNVIPIVKLSPMYHNIKRYEELSPCSSIDKRKEKVLKSATKSYIVAFKEDDDSEANRLIKALIKAKIDFKYEEGTIYMNSAYFKGIEKALASHETLLLGDIN